MKAIVNLTDSEDKKYFVGSPPPVGKYLISVGINLFKKKLNFVKNFKLLKIDLILS